jgi:hypothetical protein
MDKYRAQRIIRLLGWTNTEARRRFNAATGNSYTPGGFGNLIHGRRGVSRALAIFLRLSVRVAQLQRRLDRKP